MVGPQHILGAVVQSKSDEISKLEIKVAGALRESGFNVVKERFSIQCGYEATRDNFPLLTPDILIADTKVCVEVDSNYTHAEEEDKDRTRNNLLAAVSWTVVRLRLGGLKAIGEYDVVSESSSATKGATDALALAVADAIAGRPGHVRSVTREKRKAPRKKSRLGAIGAHNYYFNAFYVSWTLDSGEPLRLVAMAGGRYLASSSGFEAPRFICHLGLDSVAREKWRQVLEPILDAMGDDDFVPVSTFPWGDNLFVGEQSGDLVIHEKFNLGDTTFSATINLPNPDAYTEIAIHGGDRVLAELHPEAVQFGWRIAAFECRSGYRGPYQAIVLARTGAPLSTSIAD